MNRECAVEVKDLHKSFRLPNEKSSGLKQTVINFLKGIKGYKEQKVLRGISFTVEKGDFFGIVGRNGSGKSTLLKLLAGIYEPGSGSIQVNGSLVSFIELGVGFNTELTGRENIYLNGALLDFSTTEVDKMYDEIVDFAELHEFMGQKLKNYSSGMQVRLAFSIAIQAKSDILILDEVLAVGDSAFQQKCFDYFAKLKKEKRTVILVSHSMSSVEQYCNRAILIEKGQIIEKESVLKVANKYEKLFIDDINNVIEKDKDNQTLDNNWDDKFDLTASVTQGGKTKKVIEAGQNIELTLNISSHIQMERLNIGITLRDAFGNNVFSTNTRRLNNYKELNVKKDQRLQVEFDIDNYFTNGEYYVGVVLVNEGGSANDKLLLNETGVISFRVMGIKENITSMFHPGVKLEIKRND